MSQTEVDSFCQRVFDANSLQPPGRTHTNITQSKENLIDMKNVDLKLENVDSTSKSYTTKKGYLTRSMFFKRVEKENDFIQSFLQFVILTHLDININEAEDGFAIKFKSISQIDMEKETQSQET